MELFAMILLAGVFIFSLEKPARAPGEAPPPEPFRIKHSEAYRAVIQVFEQGFQPPYAWKILHCSRESGQIQAIYELNQALVREDRSVLNVKTSISCNIALTAQEDGSTDLLMRYTVSCRQPASREPLDMVIGMMTERLKEVLMEAEVSKHG